MDRDVGNIALIGYRATGKTRVARALAERLGWTHVDTDEDIQRRWGRSIREIFAEDGEQAFRDLESQVIGIWCDWRRVVLSLGGGAVLRERNRRQLRECSAMVWLQAAPEEIWRRLQGDQATATQRPPLTEMSGYDEIVAVLQQREPIYRQAADLEIQTDNKPPPQIADEIVSLLSDLTHLPEIQSRIRESLESRE